MKTVAVSIVTATLVAIVLLPLVAATGHAVGRVLGMLLMGA
jgi:hypothetical protein